MEGETDDEGINALRQRQIRNMHMALMLSQGTPMVLMGDSLPCTSGILGLRMRFEHHLSFSLQQLGCQLSDIVLFQLKACMLPCSSQHRTSEVLPYDLDVPQYAPLFPPSQGTYLGCLVQSGQHSDRNPKWRSALCWA